MKGKLFLAAALGMAVTPCVMLAQAPAGATGKCKDGTYTTAASKSGACRGHKGVDTWNGPTAAAKSATSSAMTPAAPAKPTTTTAAPAPAPAAKPATSAPAASSAPSKSTTSKTTKTAAPGGGPGMVWVNTSTKVYHCYGTADYGTTKQGKYLSEADAKAAGARAAKGQACSK